jgi:hypothetical protein
LPRLLLIALVAIAFSTSVEAQKTYAIGIGGGAAIPVGRLSDTQKTGAAGIVALALGAAELPFGVRFDGIYNSFPRSNAAGNTSGFRVAGLLGNLIYAFPASTVKPYLLAGGGIYNTRLDLTGSKSENHSGLNAGAGVTFGIGPTAAFIESRYHFVSREPSKGGVIHFVPVTFGLLF